MGPYIIPVNTPINVQIPLLQEGTYILEINDDSGEAAINLPIYVGTNLFPILPDF